MSIFGYGSLLCEDSFKSTISKYSVLGVGILSGYRRIFCVKSPSRKNEAGMPSSVLNLEKDSAYKVMGILYEIPSDELYKLHLRERGYALEEITLENGEKACTYIVHNTSCYEYIEGDNKQKEYLDLCLKASKKIGQVFHDNFLDTTFIGNVSVREWLETGRHP